MVLLVSDEVRRKNGGPRMVVTGIADDMVECRWYDGQVVQREAFREDELVRGEGQHSQHNQMCSARWCGRF